MAENRFKPQRTMWSKLFTYDHWMESIGIPIHRGFYVEDLRTLKLGWWEERECKSAFIQLAGRAGADPYPVRRQRREEELRVAAAQHVLDSARLHAPAEQHAGRQARAPAPL